MSPLTKQKQVEESKGYAGMILMGYVVVSALFIAYVVYSYFAQVVYQSGIQSGQEQGYGAAISQLIEQAGGKCEPVTINLGESKVEVIDIECLQQGPAPETTMEKMPTEG